MNKLNERLTLIANFSVVAGIVFLGLELQQNTRAIQAQTRDSITEKQMTFSGWWATSPELAMVTVKVDRVGLDGLEDWESQMYALAVHGVWREWENSLYQYEQGLFTEEEFEARKVRWRINMGFRGYREQWPGQRETFVPRFMEEIDRIVAEVDN